MEIRATALPDVKVLTPRRLGDARGYFCETWSAPRLSDHGIDIAFVQDNESLSARPGTLRGLHYQAPPFAQTKLVRVVQGAILDVAVDARRGSPTYGAWVAEELSAANGAQLLVPRGFLHGFVTLSPTRWCSTRSTAATTQPATAAVRFDEPSASTGAWTRTP